MISVGAPTEPPSPKKIEKILNLETSEVSTKETLITTVKKEKLEKLLKKEKKKEKKEGKKDKLKLEEYREKGSSEQETDGSEAEIWTADGSTTLSKKKKKSAFGLRSSHPSIVVNELQFASPVPPVAKKLSSKLKKRMNKVRLIYFQKRRNLR